MEKERLRLSLIDRRAERRDRKAVGASRPAAEVGRRLIAKAIAPGRRGPPGAGAPGRVATDGAPAGGRGVHRRVERVSAPPPTNQQSRRLLSRTTNSRQPEESR